MAKTAEDRETGIAIRFVKSYDITADTNPASVDVWACPKCGAPITIWNYIGHTAAHVVKAHGEIR